MHAGSNSILRAAVVGYGSYGRLHARKYLQHAEAELTAVVDTDPARRRLAREELPGTVVLDTLIGLDVYANIASVVSPASTHHAIACELLEHDMHLLVEKPFTVLPQQASDLLHSASAHELVLQPGHVERFDATLAALSARLPDPRYIEARRLTCWRARGGDTDVVLDLMIHDIDHVLTLVDSRVVDVHAHGIRVFSDYWDVCNAQLNFANGCVANLTASRASPMSERRMHVFARNACMLADGPYNRILLHERDTATNHIHSREHDWRPTDSLAAEVDDFIQTIRHHRKARVPAEAGYRAVEVATCITDAMESDARLVDRISAPLTDSSHAITWLQHNSVQ